MHLLRISRRTHRRPYNIIQQPQQLLPWVAARMSLLADNTLAPGAWNPQRLDPLHHPHQSLLQRTRALKDIFRAAGEGEQVLGC